LKFCLGLRFNSIEEFVDFLVVVQGRALAAFNLIQTRLQHFAQLLIPAALALK
jgi:hypothetical protein